jgi:hypothetical protein
MPHNKPDPKPGPREAPDPAPAAPQTSAEAAELLRDLQAKRESFAAQLDAVNKNQFALAAQYTLNNPQAVAQMEDLSQVEAEVLQHLKLCDAAIGQAGILLKVLQQKEIQEREAQRRKQYEGLLLAALQESRHIDAALAEVSRHLKARSTLLEEAQLYADTAVELAQLRQLRSAQATTWALGHFDLVRYIDPRMIPYPGNFASLTDYTVPRMPQYNLNEPAPEDQPPAASADVEVKHAKRVQ